MQDTKLWEFCLGMSSQSAFIYTLGLSLYDTTHEDVTNVQATGKSFLNNISALCVCILCICVCMYVGMFMHLYVHVGGTERKAILSTPRMSRVTPEGLKNKSHTFYEILPRLLRIAH